MKRDNITIVLARFATLLGIPIDTQKVYDELLTHPDYPSLLSMSDVLTTFGYEAAAFHVDSEDIVKVQCPFIAHTKLNGGDFVIVNKIGFESVSVSSEKWTRHKIPTKEFKQLFSGVVLTAEFSSVATNTRNFVSTIKRFTTPLLVGALLLLLIIGFISHTNYGGNLNWQLAALTVLKTAGIAVAVILLIQTIDGNSSMVKKFCQNKGKSNCHAILSSKAAKVLEGLTWSEVGFFYFAGTWLLLFFANGSVLIWRTLALLNLISLPYTIYSIYYQARVVKRWCRLCCIVQALLWAEFISFAVGFKATNFSLAFTPTEVCTIFTTLLLPVIIWLLFKPLLIQRQQLHPLKQQLQQFKYNVELFNIMLTEQPKHAQPDEEWAIVLGNVEANNVITMVTNPYCPPCAEEHKLLHQLLKHRTDLQARIVFTADNADNDIKTPVSRHLMTLYSLPDKTIVKQALYDWYAQKQKSYEAWAEFYPIELNECEYNKIDKQKAWCQMAEVTATPTLLLNGYRLPDFYQLTDLKYML